MWEDLGYVSAKLGDLQRGDWFVLLGQPYRVVENQPARRGGDFRTVLALPGAGWGALAGDYDRNIEVLALREERG